MNEDLKPIYDFESDWIPQNSRKDKRIIFENSKLNSLFRIVDVGHSIVAFTDVGRVCKIKDINKALSKTDNEEENKKNFLPIINRVIDEIKPISMPYVPEKLTCFIESFPGYDKNIDDVLGILYFREDSVKEEDRNMIQAKRFFKINPLSTPFRYEEMTMDTYNKLKAKWFRRCEDGLDSRSDKKTLNKQ